jgi:hypothetical protein
MSDMKKIKLSLSIIILSSIFVSLAFSEEKRSPFKNCFPPKVEAPKEVEVMQEPVIVEPVETFDVSIYKLNGLFWGPVASKVIINNEIYGLGDKLGEAEITKIDKNGVTLIFNEEKYSIKPERKIDIIEDKTQGVGDEYEKDE